jgi:hypothetical protein
VVDPELPAAVRAYLGAAIRHLPRRLRSAVQAELHANLHQRMLDHSLSLNAEAAWNAALRDFGPPESTARALRRVHRWPRLSLLRAGLAALALGGAGYAAARSLGWPPGAAEAPQVEQSR